MSCWFTLHLKIYCEQEKCLLKVDWVTGNKYIFHSLTLINFDTWICTTDLYFSWVYKEELNTTLTEAFCFSLRKMHMMVKKKSHKEITWILSIMISSCCLFIHTSNVIRPNGLNSDREMNHVMLMTVPPFSNCCVKSWEQNARGS